MKNYKKENLNTNLNTNSNTNPNINTKSINLFSIDKIPIYKLLDYSAETLFAIQTKADEDFKKKELEYNSALYRKKWINGIIELKYKTAISNFVNKAERDLIEHTEFIEKYKLINKKINTQKSIIYYIQDTDNKDNFIKLELQKNFDIQSIDKTKNNHYYDRPLFKKKFSLITKSQYFKELNNQGGF